MSHSLWGYSPHESVDGSQVTKAEERGRQLRGISRVEHGLEFGQMLQDMGLLISAKLLQPVTAWLRRANKGEQVVLASIICPDYATKEDGTSGRRTYTFDNLGSGVGLVAGRALEVHMQISHFLQTRGLSMRSVILMADDEAEDQANLDRVGLSRDEFIGRMRQSQQALVERADGVITLEAPFLTELNPKLWQESLTAGSEFLARIRKGEFSGKARNALAARGPFYERWAGRSLTPTEKQEMLYSQVAVYSACGRYLSQLFPGSFIIGADAPVMAPFAAALKSRDVASIYLKRPDY